MLRNGNQEARKHVGGQWAGPGSEDAPGWGEEGIQDVAGVSESSRDQGWGPGGVSGARARGSAMEGRGRRPRSPPHL